MQNVAVITGAASGVGRGLAERFAAEDMKVVLADVETEPLAKLKRTYALKGQRFLLSKRMSQTPQRSKTLPLRRWMLLVRCISFATMPVLSVVVLSGNMPSPIGNGC